MINKTPFLPWQCFKGVCPYLCTLKSNLLCIIKQGHVLVDFITISVFFFCRTSHHELATLLLLPLFYHTVSCNIAEQFWLNITSDKKMETAQIFFVGSKKYVDSNMIPDLVTHLHAHSISLLAFHFMIFRQLVSLCHFHVFDNGYFDTVSLWIEFSFWNGRRRQYTYSIRKHLI